MSDVEVAVTAEEIEAEVIRSRLEAEGIPARIAAKSQIGMPASWSPQGLGYGIGSFSVRVPAEHAAEARRVVGDGEPPGPASDRSMSPRPSVVRIVATILLIGFLMSLAVPLAQMLER